MNNQENILKITKGAGINFIGIIASHGFGFITFVIIARLLGPSILGLFVLGLAIFDFCASIAILGFHQGAVRFVALYKKKDIERTKGVIIQCLSFSFLAGIIMAICLFFVSPWLAQRLFSQPELTFPLRLFAMGIPVMVLFQVSTFITRGFQVMKYSVWINNFFQKLLYLGLIFLFYLLGYQLFGLIFAYLISLLVSVFLLFYFIKVLFPGIVKKNIKPKFITASLLKFSIPLLFVGILTFFLYQTDILMLGYFLTSEKVGIYKVAAQISALVVVFLSSFNLIFGPIISEIYSQGAREELKTLFQAVTKWIFYLSLPLFLIIFILPNEILNLFGSGFIEARNVVLILALAQLINAGTGNTGLILIMSGRQNIELFNTIGLFVFNFVGNLLLIPVYGIIGAAIATSATVVFFNILKLLEVYIILKIQPYNKKYLRGLSAGLLSGLITFFVKSLFFDLHWFVGLFVFSFLLILIYVGLILLFGLDAEDKFILGKIKTKLLPNK